MRVAMNGKLSDGLDPGLARRLRVRRAVDVVEGAVFSADEAVAQATRGMRLIYGVAIGVAGATTLVVLVGTAFSEPGDLVVFVPLVLVLWAGLGWLVMFVFRRNLAKVRARVGEMTALGQPGAAIRVDDSGLTVGAALYAWPDIAIDEVGVASALSGDSSYEYIERLRLTAGGRPLDLDIVGLKNGLQIVNQVWRRKAAA